MGLEETPLDREISEWKGFECVFYKGDRILFDKMMSETKQHLASFEAASGKHPTEALFMALIFQQQKMINKLLDVIETKQKKRRAV